MPDRAQVEAAVLAAIEELNQDLPKGAVLQPAPDTVLFGRGSRLDSLGLVNLIVAVESSLADRLEVDITLADEKAMSQASSPFRTVGTLVDYIVCRLEEGGDG
ncbi:MAG: acyl carrier protein [Thermoguttaceae bacterium]